MPRSHGSCVAPSSPTEKSHTIYEIAKNTGASVFVDKSIKFHTCPYETGRDDRKPHNNSSSSKQIKGLTEQESTSSILSLTSYLNRYNYHLDNLPLKTSPFPFVLRHFLCDWKPACIHPLPHLLSLTASCTVPLC